MKRFFVVISLFLFIFISTVFAQETEELTNELPIVKKQKSIPFGIIECDKDLYVIKPGEKIVAKCTVDVESINAVAVFDKVTAYETDKKFNVKKTLAISEKVFEDDKKPLGVIDRKKTIKIEFEPKSDYGKFDVSVKINKNGEMITETLDPYWVVDRGVQYQNTITEYLGSRRFNLSTEWNSNFTTYIKQVKFEVDGVNTTVWDMNGLISYWSFDEGIGGYVFDKSGNDNIGTLINMNITGNATSGWTNDSIYGNALNFDGVNDYINAGNITLGEEADVFSVSLWVKIKSREAQDKIIKYGDMFAFGFGNNETFILQIGNKTNGIQAIGFTAGYNVTEDVNSWHHWVFIYDKNNQKVEVWRDGVLVRNSLNGFNGWLTASKRPEQTLTIAYTGYTNCTIDEVMIFNRSLTENEIRQLYLTKAHYFNHTFTHTNSVFINSWKSYACNQIGECNVTTQQQYCDSGKYYYKNDGIIYACNSTLGTGNDIRLFASYIRQSTLSSEYPSVNTAIVVLIILALGIASYALFADINPITVITGVVVFLTILFLLITLIGVTKNNLYSIYENNENLGIFNEPKEFITSYPIYSIENVYAKNVTSGDTTMLVFKND
ncbi:MAG: LamG domain-containing protein [Candidatus Aenigmatarchaeota archaeon]